MLFILQLISINVNLLGFYYINPNDPAVIPILTIPKNSKSPIDSGGIEIKVCVTANIIIPAKSFQAFVEELVFLL